MERGKLEQFTEELSFLIRARYPLIHLSTYEESRCLQVIRELCRKRTSELYVWSRTEGTLKDHESANDIKDPMAILKWYEETAATDKSVLVLKDFHPYLKEPTVVRKLRDLAHQLKGRPKNILFVSALLPIPPELVKEVTVLEVPLPSRAEVESLIKKAAEVVQTESSEPIDVDSLIDAATGLTYDEIENVFAKSIVSTGKLERRLIREEKRQIVKKSGVLEFVENEQMTSHKIGGLSLLREWLEGRKAGLSAEARALRLPVPKGILLVGVPGCGKSLTALTVGKEWELPLLRLDLGRVFSGLVGSSEGNIRGALATCEAVAPCVLWVDEIEKGLSGTKSSGQSDGGTTSRVFGTLLTWMQEKKSTVFVVATANDISQLPPEFLRKGRFDEIFFVDLPRADEREEIFRIHTDRFDWSADGFDAKALAEKADGFSGAEIEQALVAARYAAFGRNETFTQDHIVQAIVETVPLSKTMGDRLDGLRDWAKHRARPASQRREKDIEDPFRSRSSRLEFAKA